MMDMFSLFLNDILAVWSDLREDKNDSHHRPWPFLFLILCLLPIFWPSLVAQVDTGHFLVTETTLALDSSVHESFCYNTCSRNIVASEPETESVNEIADQTSFCTLCWRDLTETGPRYSISQKVVAVVVPALIRDEADAQSLDDLLHALAVQTYLPDMIVVVNDGSPLDAGFDLQGQMIMRKRFVVQAKHHVAMAPSTLQCQSLHCHGFHDASGSERILPQVSQETVTLDGKYVIGQCSCSSTNRMAAVPVHILRTEQNHGPATARNVALEHLEGSFGSSLSAVFFTDVGCLPRETWIAAGLSRLHPLGLWNGPSVVLENLKDSNGERQLNVTFGGQHISVPSGVILGGVTAALGSTVLDQFYDFYGVLCPRTLPRERGVQRIFGETCLYAPTCNIVLAGPAAFGPRGLRFDPHFRTSSFEDVAFCLEARRRGFPVLLERSMVVFHDNGTQGKSFLQNLWHGMRKFAKYGAWEARVSACYPEFNVLMPETQDVCSL